MTFGKRRDDESVIAPVAESTWASGLATCSTWPGETVSASADAIIVERVRVRGIERLRRARRRAPVELVATAFVREDHQRAISMRRRARD
jgi:hypothetical protein